MLTGELKESITRGQQSMPRHTATLTLAGQDGAMLLGSIFAGVIPDIDWSINLEVDCADPLDPKIHLIGLHDRYPLYECIYITEDGTFDHLYKFTHAASELPGPYSLGGFDPITAVGSNQNP